MFLPQIIKLSFSNNGPIPASFYFRLFNMTQLKYKLIKGLMVCLGFQPGMAGWNPLSYGDTPQTQLFNFDIGSAENPANVAHSWSAFR